MACALTTYNGRKGNEAYQCTIYPTHDAADAALYGWVRQIWTEHVEDMGEDLDDDDLSPTPPDDGAEMLAEFGDWIAEDDEERPYEWHIYDNVVFRE